MVDRRGNLLVDGIAVMGAVRSDNRQWVHLNKSVNVSD